ncbi:MAG: IgA Peptidase M64 [Ignavibacteria bacterium]|nr:IgA Peptidase M64 [Ignavibacteria bacterium]
MKRTILLLLVLVINLFSQIKFDEYFTDKTLRFDYYNVGDANSQTIVFGELREEPFWGGPKKNLIELFNFGNFKYEVYDKASGKLIFSKGYSTLFAEWLTTPEAKKIKRAFSETVIFPYPKKEVVLKIFKRDRKNDFQLVYELEIDPSNPFIKKDKPNKYPAIKFLYNGNSSEKVDIVVIPEGYTKEEMEKFKKDLEKFVQSLFGSSPYKENKNNFNIWAVEAPSMESGTDIPRQNIWKNTIVNTSFYTFDTERYLMTEDNKTLRDLAGNVPYDLIYILVNTSKYGGGAIYNHYSVAASDNEHLEYLIVHEFGHGFAGLGDEYYTSQVSYEEFYPHDVEPWERNLTTLVDFDKKWKNLIDKETPIPTPATEEFKNKVGVFEGGGYVPKGVYRPMQDCTMKSRTVNNFCVVCKKTIQDVINFYCEK